MARGRDVGPFDQGGEGSRETGQGSDPAAEIDHALGETQDGSVAPPAPDTTEGLLPDTAVVDPEAAAHQTAADMLDGFTITGGDGEGGDVVGTSGEPVVADPGAGADEGGGTLDTTIDYDAIMNSFEDPPTGETSYDGPGAELSADEATASLESEYADSLMGDEETGPTSEGPVYLDQNTGMEFTIDPSTGMAMQASDDETGDAVAADPSFVNPGLISEEYVNPETGVMGAMPTGDDGEEPAGDETARESAGVAESGGPVEVGAIDDSGWGDAALAETAGVESGGWDSTAAEVPAAAEAGYAESGGESYAESPVGEESSAESAVSDESGYSTESTDSGYDDSGASEAAAPEDSGGYDSGGGEAEAAPEPEPAPEPPPVEEPPPPEPPPAPEE